MQWRNFGAKAAATAALVAGGGTLAIDQTVLNPYDDKGTHYELPIKSDIPQGERVEIAKDKAAMTLKGWNDEYAITITPQIPTATFGADKPIEQPFNVEAHRKLFSKKVGYRSGDVTAFIEPKEETENEFDIDFTLHSKPDTNIFEYKIEGAEDFDFFYQTELTAEEIAEGAERPENVVGSYAVYHKTKANNCTNCGTANYATGKAFHIYRPKVIDANGVETWAELSYNPAQRTLSVTVPQKWLDEAVYPVVVDPTFGYTVEGASASTIAAVTSDTSTRIGRTSALSESGTLNSLHVNLALDDVGVSDNVDVFTAVNTEDTGADSHVQVASVQIDNILFDTTTKAWFLFTAASESLSAGDLILNVVGNGEDMVSAAGTRLRFSFDTGASGNIYTESKLGAGSFAAAKESPWTIVETSSTNVYSIYATYTADAGGGATPQDNTYFEIISALLLFPLAYIEPRRRLI